MLGEVKVPRGTKKMTGWKGGCFFRFLGWSKIWLAGLDVKHHNTAGTNTCKINQQSQTALVMYYKHFERLCNSAFGEQNWCSRFWM